jgi:hypothetical protein
MGIQLVPDHWYRLLPNALTLFTSFASVLLCVVGTALYRRYKVGLLELLYKITINNFIGVVQLTC